MKVTESMTEDEARSERLMKKKTNEINFFELITPEFLRTFGFRP